ncbi:MAG: hypothetical protein ACLFNT_02010 [Spirochaetales bacterium]
MVRRCALIITILLLLAACQSVPPDKPEGPATTINEDAEPPSAPSVEDVPDGEDDGDPEPQDQDPADDQVVTGPIEVPEEVYNRAFEEVEAVINELNAIIQRGDFDAWREYLTEDYIDYHGDPAVLSELSRQPVLAQNGIRLRSLRDYFQQVVRPSRARARLDSLVFYSDSLVEAVTVFRGESVILYLLRKTDGQWQIDTFKEPPSETNT